MSADIELRANGYTDTATEPTTDPIYLRKAWFRREWAKADRAGGMKFTTGLAGNTIGCSLLISRLDCAAW